SSRFDSFHKAVMPVLLDAGALDLSWILARGEPVAAAYNYAWDGKVSFYQSGRRVDLPARLRPGIVIHAHAIRRAIEDGRREYDFLGGAVRYKVQLSTGTRPLVALRAVRPSIREHGLAFVEIQVARARRVRDAMRRVSDDTTANATQTTVPVP